MDPESGTSTTLLTKISNFLLNPLEAKPSDKPILQLAGSVAIGILTFGMAHALFGIARYFTRHEHHSDHHVHMDLHNKH